MSNIKAKKPVKSPKSAVVGADQYNDPTHNYQDYWLGRDYEHAAEELAISRLLKKKRFKHAVDVGGGYGRLSKYLTAFADQVTLAEPSKQQLDIARTFLKDVKNVDQKLLKASDLKFGDNEVDLVMIVRVLHHIPDPGAEFREISRILKPGGTFLLEFANSAHGLNQVRFAMKRRRVPRKPINARQEERSSGERNIPFVNHHPKTIIKMLDEAGFEVESVLSGSNLRSATLKKLLGKKTLIGLEKILQPTLAPFYFGPSVWLRLKKK